MILIMVNKIEVEQVVSREHFGKSYVTESIFVGDDILSCENVGYHIGESFI